MPLRGTIQDILHTGWINEWMCILTTSSFRGRDLPTNCLNVRCLQALICYLNMTGEDKNSSAWGFRKRTWNVWCAAKWTNKEKKSDSENYVIDWFFFHCMNDKLFCPMIKCNFAIHGYRTYTQNFILGQLGITVSIFVLHSMSCVWTGTNGKRQQPTSPSGRQE